MHVPHLQMGKLRHREGELLVQGHTASRQRSQDLNPRSSGSRGCLEAFRRYHSSVADTVLSLGEKNCKETDQVPAATAFGFEWSNADRCKGHSHLLYSGRRGILGVKRSVREVQVCPEQARPCKSHGLAH